MSLHQTSGVAVPPYLAGFEAGWEAAVEWLDGSYIIEQPHDTGEVFRESRLELLGRLRRLLS